jgi:hypothetical protein
MFCAVASFSKALLIPATSSAATNCTMCETEVVLTKRQIQCLDRRLTAYLRKSVDPVMVSLLSCDNEELPADITSGKAAPVVVPRVEPGGDDAADSKVLFLTRRQIGCLKDAFGALKPIQNDPVIFKFDHCGATTAGGNAKK